MWADNIYIGTSLKQIIHNTDSNLCSVCRRKVSPALTSSFQQVKKAERGPVHVPTIIGLQSIYRYFFKTDYTVLYIGVVNAFNKMKRCKQW